MPVWTSGIVADVLAARPVEDAVFTSIETDTRSMRPGALFVALRGERFDGHDYLEQASSDGALGVVISREVQVPDGLLTYRVPDTLVALGKLARHQRRGLRGPVVAVTGTNGKTSTKEMIAALMRVRWHTHATARNLNNRVGVPLTILGAAAGTEALVVEAGANEPGEIGHLRTIIEPDVAVITNVAPGHLDGFEDLDGVMREKLSLLTGAHTAVVGLDPPDLALRAREIVARVVTGGLDDRADVHADSWSIGAHGRGRLVFGGREVEVSVPGQHQLDNAVIAIAAVATLGLDIAMALESLERVELPGGRCEVIERLGLTIIDDTYNANPASMKAAFDLAARLRGKRPLVVLLGSMLELGTDAARYHEEIGQAAMSLSPTLVGAVGDFVHALEGLGASRQAKVITAGDPQSLGRLVAARLNGDEVILLKASRGVHLEAAIPFLIPDTETSCSTTS